MLGSVARRAFVATRPARGPSTRDHVSTRLHRLRPLMLLAVLALAARCVRREAADEKADSCDRRQPAAQGHVLAGQDAQVRQARPSSTATSTGAASGPVVGQARRAVREPGLGQAAEVRHGRRLGRGGQSFRPASPRPARRASSSSSGRTTRCPTGSSSSSRPGSSRPSSRATARTATSRSPRSGSIPTHVAEERQERGRAPRSATPTRSRSPATSTSPNCSTTSTRRLRRSARSASPGGASCPRSSRAEQRKQAADAIKDVNVEIYTGKDDTILRRVVHVALDLPSNGGQAANVDPLDFHYTDVNEGQDIKRPSNAKPFDQLWAAPGARGAPAAPARAGRARRAAARAPAAAPTRRTSRSTPTACQAGTDAAKAQKCADLLTK